MFMELDLEQILRTEQLLEFFKTKIKQSTFKIVGTWDQKRDFIYVSDVCEAFYKSSILKISNKILNIGSGKPHRQNF